MPKPNHIDLMAYYDGELSPEEEAEVRAELAAGGDSARVIESLDQVGETVRTYVELAADDEEVRLARMWDRLERRIQANGTTDEAPAAAPVKPSRPAAEAGVWASIRRWLGEHRGHLVSSTVTAAAVAALMFVLLPSGERIVERPGPERIVQVPVQPTSPVVPVASQPAAVEELSVNDGTGYILTIPGDKGESDTTVLWVEPEENPVEGPI